MQLKFIVFHLFMRDTRAHGRNMRRCRLHPTCMEVKRPCAVSPWDSSLSDSLSLSLSPFNEIGNGAVIEDLETTRCGYVTRVIVIERTRVVKQETYTSPWNSCLFR